EELGWARSRTSRSLAGLSTVKGRLQFVVAEGGHQVAGPMVVVDYAHTPDALVRALQALRSVAEARGGRVICLFGCGGNRDRGKRRVMGDLADQLADEVIVTNDNPRDEDPMDIVRSEERRVGKGCSAPW